MVNVDPSLGRLVHSIVLPYARTIVWAIARPTTMQNSSIIRRRSEGARFIPLLHPVSDAGRRGPRSSPPSARLRPAEFASRYVLDYTAGFGPV